MIFESFIKNFNWAYNDSFADEMTGQFGIGFTIFLLFKYGNEERSVQFYADKYMKAFPKLIDNFPEYTFSPKEKQLYNVYQVRAFQRFLLWFNFIEITARETYNPPQSMTIKSTELLQEVFKIVK